MNIHEIKKALQENAPELKELSVQDIAKSIIENHPNPRSKQLALGVFSFYESGMALSENQSNSIKNTYSAMNNTQPLLKFDLNI